MATTDDMTFVSAQELHKIEGDWPTGYEEMTAWKDEVAQAIAAEATNGFQYGVDISAGNVECGYLENVGGTWIVRTPDDAWSGLAQESLPSGVIRSTYCFFSSWQ